MARTSDAAQQTNSFIRSLAPYSFFEADLTVAGPVRASYDRYEAPIFRIPNRIPGYSTHGSLGYVAEQGVFGGRMAQIAELNARYASPLRPRAQDTTDAVLRASSTRNVHAAMFGGQATMPNAGFLRVFTPTQPELHTVVLPIDIDMFTRRRLQMLTTNRNRRWSERRKWNEYVEQQRERGAPGFEEALEDPVKARAWRQPDKATWLTPLYREYVPWLYDTVDGILEDREMARARRLDRMDLVWNEKEQRFDKRSRGPEYRSTPHPRIPGTPIGSMTWDEFVDTLIKADRELPEDADPTEHYVTNILGGAGVVAGVAATAIGVPLYRRIRRARTPAPQVASQYRGPTRAGESAEMRRILNDAMQANSEERARKREAKKARKAEKKARKARDHERRRLQLANERKERNKQDSRRGLGSNVGGVFLMNPDLVRPDEFQADRLRRALGKAHTHGLQSIGQDDMFELVAKGYIR